MRTFFLTFPTRFSYDPHPHWKRAHPDGWVEVQAVNELDARDKVFKAIKDVWAFLYNEESFDKSFFPKGKLATYKEMLSEVKIEKGIK